MALNILSQPQQLQPAYNPLLFTFSGSNYSKVGYRYVVEVFDTNANQSIGTYKVAPLPDGSGKIDISRVVSNSLTVSFNPLTNITNNATNSYFNYSIRLGEEFQTDPIPFLLTSSLTAGTLIMISSSANTNTYIAGDQILVKTNGTFSGLYQVLSPLLTSTAVTIQSTWDTQNWTGTTNYADGRKKQTLGITNVSGFTAFNGAFGVGSNLSYIANDYIVSGLSTTDKFLTNMPVGFTATYTQDIKLNTYISKLNSYVYGVSGITDNSITFTSLTTTGLNKEVTQFNVGATALNVSPLAKYYDFYLYRRLGATVEQISKTYRITLDNRCKINDYEIAFQDRLGSINSFAFQLRSKDTGTIDRIQYKQQLDDNYNTYDRGKTNIFITLQKQLELNTNWMNDAMSVYFEELLSSPYTWIKIGGIYYACTIVDTSFEIERQLNKKLIRKTVVIQYANNDSINT